MKWIQSRPTDDSPDYKKRSYVVDQHMESVVIYDYDYRPVLEQMDEDTVIIEWDIAISSEARKEFEDLCASWPRCVQVAPYRIYPTSSGHSSPLWVHRNEIDRPIRDGDDYCRYFGFGCVYLPISIVKMYLAEIDGPCTDHSFSIWHTLRFPEVVVPVHWLKEPVVHLHY